MIRSILLAGTMIVSVPVLAQAAPAQQTTPPSQETTSPAQETTSPAEEQTLPPESAARAETPAPAEQTTPTEQPAQTAQQPAPAQQPAQGGQQPANATQIAQVVDSGFPTYDKDADGNLKAEEFNSWMVALRSATEPAFNGQSAADKEWLTRALAKADADKSGTVNKDELKTFLAPAVAS